MGRVFPYKIEMYKPFKITLLTGFTVAILLAALIGYAYFIEPYQLVVKEVPLKLPHWSKELNGFRIVAVSDIHGGSHSMTEERLQTLAGQINAQNPDIVVLLGDYVSQMHVRDGDLKMPIETVAENIKGISAKYGVYAVIGNHDWWYDEKKCREEFERIGFVVLENQSSSISVNGKKITIIGIEDFWKRSKADISAVVSRIEIRENLIAITHNPDSFDQTPDSLSLLIAGHTHGGQVNLPLLGPPILVAKREYQSGLVEKNGRSLFVTTGVGSNPPFRFRVPPEIVVLTLEAKE